MESLSNHLEYTKIFLAISVGMIALICLVHVIFNGKKIARYIPGIISIIVGLYGLLTIDSRIIFLDDTKKLTIFIIGTTVGIIGILVAFLIGIYSKKRIPENKKIEKSEESN